MAEKTTHLMGATKQRKRGHQEPGTKCTLQAVILVTYLLQRIPAFQEYPLGTKPLAQGLWGIFKVQTIINNKLQHEC
jgi:hypothetical protein